LLPISPGLIIAEKRVWFLYGVEMNRSRALELLAESKPTLASRFGVTELALFGSTARNNARTDSDVDILVAFDGPATSERYFGTQFYLEDLFGCKIDMVTEKALRAELRPYIEKEAVRV
jgi:predicted nucleotidyltransferase